MKLIKRKDVFWVDFRAPDGLRRRMSTGTTVESAAYAEAGRIVQSFMSNGDKPMPARLLVPTLGALLLDHLERHWMRISYGKNMRYTVAKLVREIGHHPCSDVTEKWWREQTNRWQNDKLSVSTINRYRSALTPILAIAKADKHIAEVPKLSMFSEKRLQRERYMFDHEETALLTWFDRMFVDDRAEDRWEWEYMKNLVVFLTDTGYRFTEAFRFQLINSCADIDLEDDKTAKGRRLPLTPRALAAAQYLLASEHHQDLNRRTTYDQPGVAWTWCGPLFRRATLACGINKADTPRRRRLTLHCLRHTCATRMLERGVNLVVVSKWLGHSSIQTTMRYIKVEAGAFDSAMNVLVETPPPAKPLHGTRSLHSWDESSTVGTRN